MPDGSPFEAWVATVRALLCRNGVEQMELDAEIAVPGLTAASPWRPASLLLHAVAVLLSGDPSGQRLGLRAGGGGSRRRRRGLGRRRRPLASSRSSRWSGATSPPPESELARRGLIDEAPSPDYVITAIVLAVTARLAIARGSARGRARRSQRAATAPDAHPRAPLVLRPLSARARDGPPRAGRPPRRDDALPRGAATHQAPAGARHAGGAQRRSARSRLRCRQTSGWASTLTAAELRLLPLLTTHLSFREIAARLFVSRNTVKTQAISIYRKLDASSRSEAIERAAELGLVDAAPASRAPISPARGDDPPARRHRMGSATSWTNTS